MKELNEIVGSVGYDELINGAFPPADVFGVTIRKREAEVTLKRGTVLALASGGDDPGKMVVLGTEKTGEETLAANCVLADDVTVGTEEDATAVAYRTGHFNRNKLVVADEYTITAEDEEELRKGGILLDDAIEA